jgi:hypothetical protein
MRSGLRLFSVISITLILSAVVFYACKIGTNQNKPAVVAEKFIRHLSMFEFEEARQLGNENTSKMITMLSAMYELSKRNAKAETLQPKDAKVEIIKTAVDGKNAVVTYKKEDGTPAQIDLVKVKGKWLVNMKKEMPALSPGKSK